MRSEAVQVGGVARPLQCYSQLLHALRKGCRRLQLRREKDRKREEVQAR